MKKAFTMMELIFIIIVIGILVAVILPSTRRNPVQEAALQLLSHIRYTQHLALIDDKYNPNRKDNNGNIIWFKDRWQLVFSQSQYTKNAWAYTIFSDTYGTAVSRGDANEDEIARNPEDTQQLMTGGYSVTQALNYTNVNFKGMKKLNLGISYNISSVLLSSSCNSSNRISFDHLGRPLQGDHNSMKGAYKASTQRLITSDCNITLSDGSNSAVITIRPETGYANITF